MTHDDMGMRRFHPYEIKLKELLGQGGYTVQVHQRGISGERVVGEMETRLPHLLHSAKEHGINFGWVVILGGINDLGHGAEPARVWEGLQKLYAAVKEHGGRVLAMTCFETAFGKRRPEMDLFRQELNKMIRSGVEGSDFIKLLDAENLIPQPSDPSDTATAALWDDGLHLTPAGYDKLGTFVFEALRSELKTTHWEG